MSSDPSFQELQKRMMQLEARVAFLYNHLGVTFEPQAAAGDDPRIIELITKGNMMEAIKLYRETHDQSAAGISFAEAKQAVEEMVQRLGI